jgi:hexosaminidase
MEHVLKLEEFTSLREVSNNPQSICPSKINSVEIIQTMIDQLMSVHQEVSKFLHIGCDEVFQLGLCNQCKSRISRSNNQQQMDSSAAGHSEFRTVSPY